MASFKRVSQSTFDEIVKENIDEFDMEPEEALKEAISQFQKQGVDLSNLDLTGGIGRQEMLDAMSNLNKLALSNADCAEELLGTIAQLRKLCDKTSPLTARNVMLMKEEGGVNSLHLLLDNKQPVKVIISASDFLNELSSMNERIRDFFEPGGSHKVVGLLQQHSVLREEQDTSQLTLLVSLLSLCRTVMRTENNKTMLMKAGLGATLTTYFSPLPPLPLATPFHPLFDKICTCIRGLSVHDDYRQEMSSAMDNGKFFLKQASVVAGLMTLATPIDTPALSAHPAVSAAALAAARALVTTNEAVQVLSLHGAVELVLNILKGETKLAGQPSEGVQQGSRLGLLRSALGLLRNIAADDVKKESYLAQGGLAPLLFLGCTAPYCQDAALIDHLLACLAQFSLRSPSQSTMIVQRGGVEVLVRAMRTFVGREALQRQACLTIRNIAGRCPELHATLLDAGVEGVLREAGRLPSVVDEAYAAMRDLNIDVQFVKVDTDGTVQPMYEHFGEKQGKLNFKPVFEATCDLEERVEENAKAPFARHCEDSDCDDHDH
eukprot:gene33564-40604_t